MGPHSVTGIIVTRGEFHLRVTKKKTGRCERDWSEANISPGKL